MKLQLGVVPLISLLLFWRGVLGGQIPKVNGVLGGVSARWTVGRQEVSESVKRTTERTPGKLRGVVENSGVCGSLVTFSFVQFRVCNAFFFFRNDSRSLSGFRVW